MNREELNKLRKEFYELHTDGRDEDNFYYDSQFEGIQPVSVWCWIEDKLVEAHRAGFEEAKREFYPHHL